MYASRSYDRGVQPAAPNRSRCRAEKVPSVSGRYLEWAFAWCLISVFAGKLFSVHTVLKRGPFPNRARQNLFPMTLSLVFYIVLDDSFKVLFRSRRIIF